jgi:uncharacterized protein YvpB
MFSKVLGVVFAGIIFLVKLNSPVHAQELAVPNLIQERNLSCEVAATDMVLSFLGKDIQERDLQASLPLNPNPYLGFRGNVDGRLGFKDYGVYAPPIANLLTSYGVSASPVTGIDEEIIKQKLLEGKPTIIWGTARARGRGKTVIEEMEGQTYKLVLGEHTFVVIGYEDGRWIINDSLRSSPYKVKSLDSLGWNSLDRMAVILN